MIERSVIRATPLPLEGLCLLEPAVTETSPHARFSYYYDERDWAALGLPGVVQQHASRYAPRHTVRGLHFQTASACADQDRRRGARAHPRRGGRCQAGVTDLRPACGARAGSGLAPARRAAGFAHGFCTLEPDTEVVFALSDFNEPHLLRWLAVERP
jgi:dTDP-4-dehydrorhamnose 3,5-epimerase